MAAGERGADALVDLYREMWRCMVEKDLDGLAACCADDFALYHMTGVRQDRQEFLDAVADGTLNYYEVSHDLVEPRVDETGERATLLGRSRVLAAVYGGGRHVWRLEGRLVARCGTDGVWRFTEERTGTY